MKILETTFNVLIVFLLLAAVASSRYGKFLGKDNKDFFSEVRSTEKPEYPLPAEDILRRYGASFTTYEKEKGIWKNSDQVFIYYSESYVNNISGYAGATPVYIIVKEDEILEIIAADNVETPSFFRKVLDSGLLDRWKGYKVSDASSVNLDGITGATLSSEALINTIVATAAQIDGRVVDTSAVSFRTVFTVKNVAAILVLLFGLITSFILKKKKWRNLQLSLNIAVLGFWCGNFISFTWLIGWLASGANFWVVLIPAMMLVMAVILPLFKKKSYYCTWICPYGAAQEMVSKIPVRKIKISSSVMSYLKYSREAILFLILVLAWLGISFDIMDYEPFSAFIFDKADTVVIVVALLFLVLSLFVHRPWCRFACPTGQILEWSQTNKKIKK